MDAEIDRPRRRTPGVRSRCGPSSAAHRDDATRPGWWGQWCEVRPKYRAASGKRKARGGSRPSRPVIRHGNRPAPRSDRQSQGGQEAPGHVGRDPPSHRRSTYIDTALWKLARPGGRHASVATSERFRLTCRPGPYSPTPPCTVSSRSREPKSSGETVALTSRQMPR